MAGHFLLRNWELSLTLRDSLSYFANQPAAASANNPSADGLSLSYFAKQPAADGNLKPQLLCLGIPAMPTK